MPFRSLTTGRPLLFASSSRVVERLTPLAVMVALPRLGTPRARPAKSSAWLPEHGGVCVCVWRRGRGGVTDVRLWCGCVRAPRGAGRAPGEGHGADIDSQADAAHAAASGRVDLTEPEVATAQGLDLDAVERLLRGAWRARGTVGAAVAVETAGAAVAAAGRVAVSWA